MTRIGNVFSPMDNANANAVKQNFADTNSLGTPVGAVDRGMSGRK